MEREQIERGIVRLYQEFCPTRRIKKNWDCIFENPDYHLLYTADGDKVIGTMTCMLFRNPTGRGRDYMMIDNIIVHHDYRRNGVARNLLLDAQKFAKKKNCYKILIVSNRKFTGAQKFYLKQGFENKSSKVYIKHL